MSPQLSLFAGAVCIAFAPIFVKLSSLGPNAAGLYRCLFGALAFLLYFLLREKRAPIVRDSNAWRWLILAGLIFALDLAVWHRSIQFAGAGMATILGNTQVFYLCGFGFFIFSEKINARFLSAVVLAFTGICLLIGFESEVTRHQKFYWGVGFGLATGLIYACYILCLRKIEQEFRELSTALRMFFVSWISMGGLFLFSLSSQTLEPLAGRDWLWMILLGVIAQFLGWFLITKNLPRVDISRAGLIILTQPALATVMGAGLFDERLSLIQSLGAGLTLCAIYLGNTSRRVS